MSKRNITALALILISLICLIPGLTRNILTIEVGASLPLVGEVNLYSATRSILGTIQELRENDNTFVGFLILLFSVIVPIIKTISLLLILFYKKLQWRKELYTFIAAISKWSMADVFVVGVFLSFLASKSNDNINAQLHDGFYYFLAYCILSIIASQIMKVEED